MDPKNVNRTDCDQVIKKCVGSDQFEVVNFKLKPFEDKEREYYKPECVLEISAKISKNISRFRFFVKRFATDYPALNLLMQSTKASEREMLFYEHFLPMLKEALETYETDFVADYLYGQIHRFIILEDMSLKFFTLTKKANPHVLDRFHVTLALKAAARLHAASWIYEEKLKDAEGSRLFEENDLLGQEPIWRDEGKKTIYAGVKGLKTLFKECRESDKILEAQIDSLTEKTFSRMHFQTKFRNVLTHGSLYTKNVLFKYNKHNVATDCVLINFGYCRYYLPAYDVLTMIFCSTNRLFRQHYFTYLIKYYYECLHNELMKHDLHINQFLTYEDFLKSINFLTPAIKLQAALHLQDFGAKPGFYKLLQRDDALYQTHLYQDKSFFMRELCKKDPLFKEMAVEALEELVEVLQTPQVSRENCYEILEGQLGTTVYDLKAFSVSESDERNSELLLEVSEGDPKKEEVNKYKYAVQCGSDGLFKLVPNE